MRRPNLRGLLCKDIRELADLCNPESRILLIIISRRVLIKADAYQDFSLSPPVRNLTTNEGLELPDVCVRPSRRREVLFIAISVAKFNAR
jgi:hypothetical protein